MIYLFIIMLILPAYTTTDTKHFVLENGLNAMIIAKPHAQMAHVVIAIDIGSKDENETNSGLVHILEHLVLLGSTQFQTGDEFIEEMRRNGCIFNAHTDRDLMTFEMSLPRQFLEKGLLLARSKLFALKFTDIDLQREKQVILEEISQTMDDPTQYGIVLALQKLYQGSSYERPVFGNPEIIEKASIAQINSFYKQYFIPNNCSIAVVGDYKITEVELKIKQTFSALSKGIKPSRSFSQVKPLKKNIFEEHEIDVKQSRLIIALSAPDFNHPDRLPVNVLTQILGQGINPMLGSALRVRKRLVERLSMSYFAQQHGGSIIIHLSMEPGNVKSVQREIFKFLKRTRVLNYAKTDYVPNQQRYVFDYLEAAKNRLQLIFEAYQERGLDVAVSYARAMLLQNQSLKESYTNSLQRLKSKHVRKAAGQYIAGKSHVMIAIMPKKGK